MESKKFSKKQNQELITKKRQKYITNSTQIKTKIAQIKHKVNE